MTLFWINNPCLLISGYTLNPQSLEEKFNTLTQLVFIIWIILMLMGYKDHDVFLLSCLVFIIIIYTIIKKEEMYQPKNKYLKENIKENYTEIGGGGFNLPDTIPNYMYYPNSAAPPTKRFNAECQNATLPLEDWNTLPKGNDLKFNSPSQYRFCLDSRPSGTDQSFYSTNQALAGPPNNKTLAPCPVIAPSHAWDYWSEDFCVPSQINKETHQELFQSGYIGLSQCNQYTDVDMDAIPRCSVKTKNGFQTRFNTRDVIEREYHTNAPLSQITKESFQHATANIPTNANTEYTRISDDSTLYTDLSPSGLKLAGYGNDTVNGCNYDPSQIAHGIPSNVATGICAQNDELNEYNRNMYTQTITPGFYQQNQVVDPIQSNMGITYAQQFEPVSCTTRSDGSKMVTVHDPNVYKPEHVDTYEVEPNRSNVYDPRLSGYGDSQRSYVDTMTGQPRFYYDDIDVVNRPNYIVRSNIDHAPWSGSNQYNKMGLIPNGVSRLLANSQFIFDTSSQRSDLQASYMKKFNSTVGPQRRLAPLRRDNGGAISLCK